MPAVAAPWACLIQLVMLQPSLQSSVSVLIEFMADHASVNVKSDTYLNTTLPLTSITGWFAWNIMGISLMHGSGYLTTPYMACVSSSICVQYLGVHYQRLYYEPCLIGMRSLACFF